MEEFDDKDYSNMEEEFTYVDLAFMEDQRRDKRIKALEERVGELEQYADLLEAEIDFICALLARWWR